MSDPLVPTAEELAEDASDWGLIALLLEPPRSGWGQSLVEAARGTVDPELALAVKLAQREGNESFYDCLLGPEGGLGARESAYRGDTDEAPLMADLEALARQFAFDGFESGPADHVAALAEFMSHLLRLEAEAVTVSKIGEAVYLDGVVQWLRKAHLAWFAEQLGQALAETEVCYLSHVGHAMMQRVSPPGDDSPARPRPSDEKAAVKTWGKIARKS